MYFNQWRFFALLKALVELARAGPQLLLKRPAQLEYFVMSTIDNIAMILRHPKLRLGGLVDLALEGTDVLRCLLNLLCNIMSVRRARQGTCLDQVFVPVRIVRRARRLRSSSRGAPAKKTIIPECA